MAVNGFHPQLNAQINPVLPLSGTAALPAGQVQLVDARSKKNNRAGKERNEREQKRAQKITELIEKLRISMENGGWKVEMKSKFHTLSTYVLCCDFLCVCYENGYPLFHLTSYFSFCPRSCADYVRHLAKATQEKEEAVAKAKNDLEMKERKLEEKNSLEARSDPESVTSSLTAMTSESTSNKRKADNKNNNEEPNQKKSKPSTSGDASSEDSASENGPCEHNNITLDKMSSSMSELTDSNKGSDSGDGKKMNASMASSISSTAAVVRGSASSKREQGHADVVVKTRKKGASSQSDTSTEPTSLDPDFELDYEAVFVTSNVPQLIATPAGRIVACKLCVFCFQC